MVVKEEKEDDDKYMHVTLSDLGFHRIVMNGIQKFLKYHIYTSDQFSQNND